MLAFRLAFDDIAIHSMNSELVLQGVRIDIDEVATAPEESDHDDRDPALSCVNGAIVLRDFELNAGIRPCVELVASDCEFTRSTLTSLDAAILAEPTAGSTLAIKSSRIVGSTGVYIPEAAGGAVQVQDTTFEAGLAIELPYDVEAGVRLSINADRNDFDCEEALLAVNDINPGAFDRAYTDLASRLPFTWRGTDNELPGTAMVLSLEGGDQERKVSRRWFVKNVLQARPGD